MANSALNYRDKVVLILENIDKFGFEDKKHIAHIF